MVKTIVISDDHPLFRQALLATVRPLFGSADILEAETLAETLEILKERQVDLLLLDLRMRDSRGLVGLMNVKSRHPEVPVVVVSASDEAETVRVAFLMGAKGFIVKSAPFGKIRNAIVRVFQGETVVPSAAPTAASGPQRELSGDIGDPGLLLSPTQLRVLVKMTDGLLNKQISAELGIAECTVKSHVTEIFRKLKVHTRVQAVIMVISSGQATMITDGYLMKRSGMAGNRAVPSRQRVAP